MPRLIHTAVLHGITSLRHRMCLICVVSGVQPNSFRITRPKFQYTLFEQCQSVCARPCFVIYIQGRSGMRVGISVFVVENPFTSGLVDSRCGPFPPHPPPLSLLLFSIAPLLPPSFFTSYHPGGSTPHRRPPSRLPLWGPVWDSPAPHGARRVPLRPGAGARAVRPRRAPRPSRWHVHFGLPGRPRPPLCRPHRHRRRRRSATDVHRPAAARRRRRHRPPPCWQTRRVAAGSGTRL